MKDKLQKIGIESSFLDGLVESSAIEKAHAANNDGMKSQIDFMNQHGWDDERIWKEILQNLLEPGMTVEISEPMHEDSVHVYSFVGTFVADKGDHLVVRDMDDEHLCVSYDEVMNFEI